MRALVFNLACLACAGHARNLQMAVEQTHSDLNEAPLSSQPLAKLLLALSPATGYLAPQAFPRQQRSNPRATVAMQDKSAVDKMNERKMEWINRRERNFAVRFPNPEGPADMVIANGGKSMEDYARWEPGYKNPTPWYTEGDMPDWLFDYEDFEDAFNEALPFWKPEEDLETMLIKCKGPEDVDKAIADCLAAGARPDAPVFKTANKLKKDMEKAMKDGKKMPKAKAKKKVAAKPAKYERGVALTHDNSIQAR